MSSEIKILNTCKTKRVVSTDNFQQMKASLKFMTKTSAYFLLRFSTAEEGWQDLIHRAKILIWITRTLIAMQATTMVLMLKEDLIMATQSQAKPIREEQAKRTSWWSQMGLAQISWTWMQTGTPFKRNSSIIIMEIIMCQMANLIRALPKREVKRPLNNKTITITLTLAIIMPTLSWRLSILKALSRTRKERALARVRGVMGVVQSISTIRRWRGPKLTEMQPMLQGWTASAHLSTPLKIPTTQAKELGQ